MGLLLSPSYGNMLLEFTDGKTIGVGEGPLHSF
jgi:hypothetical protein